MAVAGVMLSVGRQVSPMRVVLAKGSFHLCVSTFLNKIFISKYPKVKWQKEKAKTTYHQ